MNSKVKKSILQRLKKWKIQRIIWLHFLLVKLWRKLIWRIILNQQKQFQIHQHYLIFIPNFWKLKRLILFWFLQTEEIVLRQLLTNCQSASGEKKVFHSSNLTKISTSWKHQLQCSRLKAMVKSQCLHKREW